MLHIVQALSSYRFDLSNEMELQGQIAKAFTAKGILFEREVRLNAKDRIDFMCGQIGVEVKIQGQAKSIYRQLCRYVESPLVSGLVVATGRSIVLPPELNGIPVSIVYLGRGWL